MPKIPHVHFVSLHFTSTLIISNSSSNHSTGKASHLNAARFILDKAVDSFKSKSKNTIDI